MSKSQLQIAPVEPIERNIYLIRGQKVMLDSDLATLYQVTTSRMNEAVKRNRNRFPEDFMFQLTDREMLELNSSQFAMSSKKNRGIRYLPYAFSEHGVAMLSAVLRSERAVHMSILIVRAFVKIRELLASNKELAARVEKLETDSREHRSIIALLVSEIDGMKRLPEPKRRGIGFTANFEETE